MPDEASTRTCHIALDLARDESVQLHGLKTSYLEWTAGRFSTSRNMAPARTFPSFQRFEHTTMIPYRTKAIQNDNK